MNGWFLTAAALSALTLLLHVIGGGADVHAPILESGLPVLLAAYVSILWHAVTVMLAVSSGALFVAATRPPLAMPLALLVGALYACFAVLFVVYGAARLGSLWPMPQWIIFGAIDLFVGVGLFRLRGGSLGQGQPA